MWWINYLTCKAKSNTLFNLFALESSMLRPIFQVLINDGVCWKGSSFSWPFDLRDRLALSGIEAAMVTWWRGIGDTKLTQRLFVIFILSRWAMQHGVLTESQPLHCCGKSLVAPKPWNGRKMLWMIKVQSVDKRNVMNYVQYATLWVCVYMDIATEPDSPPNHI